jgi:hypothetical protein
LRLQNGSPGRRAKPVEVVRLQITSAGRKAIEA